MNGAWWGSGRMNSRLSTCFLLSLFIIFTKGKWRSIHFLVKLYFGAQMELVWYQWVSFVELFVTRRTNPEGFSSATEVFRQKQHRYVGKSWEAASMDWGIQGAWPCLCWHSRTLQWDLQHFVLQPRCFAAQPWGNHPVPPVPHAWIRIYLPGLQLQSSCGFAVGQEGSWGAAGSKAKPWECLDVFGCAGGGSLGVRAGDKQEKVQWPW